VRLLAAHGNGGLVVVARDIAPIRDLRERVLTIMLASGAGGGGSGAGFALSLGPMRRIARFQVMAARIAAGDLATRLPLAGGRDELDLIAGIINTMVAEIERLMAQVKGRPTPSPMTAHPLTHLRGRLDRLAHA
jgi:methyl-accepting chemotaxis protein